MLSRKQILGSIGVILCFILVQKLVLTYEDEDLPLSKLSQNVGAPTLKFFYCYSCGYKKLFSDYTAIIAEKYPYISVEGDNYDPPGYNAFLARLMGLFKYLCITCILSGINIFLYFNQPQPSWWTWCLENKLYSCLMLFFLGNLIEGQLMQSGAFEITLNDVPVWSKLETGRIPQPSELFQIIDRHMEFDNKIDLHTNFAK